MKFWAGWKEGKLTMVGLTVVLIIQTVVYIGAGMSKAYIHMDEAYSLALVQYKQVEIQENEDFYNHWHSREYFQDYLAVQEAERGDFSAVYENQKNDVHPPLFYLLLRIMMEVGGLVTGGEFSKWPGIILNILIASVNTVLVFQIVMALLGKEKQGDGEKRRVVLWALGLTLVVALTNATIGGVVYIRMYELLTMFVLMTVWWNLRLVQSREGARWWIWCGIGVTAFLGVLTQYYYLFFLVPMWVVMTVWHVRRGRWQEGLKYTGVLGIAGVLSLVVWPYEIQHMFFGYRGQGVIQSFLDLSGWLSRVWQYILVLDYDGFHRMLLVFGGLMVAGGAVWWMKRRGDRQSQDTIAWKIVAYPTVIYFLIVAAVSPFIELRYIMPVTSLMLVIVVLGVAIMWRKVGASMKKVEMAVRGLLAIMLVLSPVQITLGMMRIELLYRDKEALMQELMENAETPALYMITTENNRFLDNILPFATLEESYLALDVKPDEGLIEEIMEGKDLSMGLYLFVSDKMDDEAVLKAVTEATGLREVRWVRGVNTCEIYYLSS